MATIAKPILALAFLLLPLIGGSNADTTAPSDNPPAAATTADSVYADAFHFLATGHQSDAERVLAEAVAGEWAGVAQEVAGSRRTAQRPFFPLTRGRGPRRPRRQPRGPTR